MAKLKLKAERRAEARAQHRADWGANHMHVCHIDLGGDDAPDPNPGAIAQAQASEKVGLEQVALGREQFAWNKERAVQQDALTKQVVDSMLGTQRKNDQRADENQAFYMANARPIEQQVFDEAKNFDSQAEIDKQVAEAAGTTSSAFDQAEEVARRNAGRFGNPNDGQFAALANSRAIARAGAIADTSNKTRDNVKAMGRAIRLNAANFGRGFPATTLSQDQVSLQAGTGANNASLGATAAVNQGTALGSNMIGQGANTIGQAGQLFNAEYQNRLNQFNAQQNANSGAGALLGTAAGALMFMSSKKLKRHRKQVEEGAALEAVNDMPIDTYQYKEGVQDGGALTHVGTMAEDFQRETGSGDGTMIPAQDAVGLTMGAVQDLSKRLDRIEGALSKA